jgi:uncharacterized protein YoxC
MDVALTVFRVGVGIGAVLVGLALVIAVVWLRPLVRDVRALSRDAARLAQVVDEELPALLDHARSVAADAERLTEDLAVRVEQLQASPSSAGGRSIMGPVQSADAAEGEQIA